jgi:hypothetical protein
LEREERIYEKNTHGMPWIWSVNAETDAALLSCGRSQCDMSLEYIQRWPSWFDVLTPSYSQDSLPESLIEMISLVSIGFRAFSVSFFKARRTLRVRISNKGYVRPELYLLISSVEEPESVDG